MRTLAAVALVAPVAFYTYAPKDSSSLLYLPVKFTYPYLGRIPEVIWKIIAVLHVLEAFYTARLCRKHQTGFIVGVSVMSSCRNQPGLNHISVYRYNILLPPCSEGLPRLWL